MNCESCTTPMLPVYGQTHFHCSCCNRFEFTECSLAIENIECVGKETGFQCPKCNLALSVGVIQESVQVCFCNNCRGFVIDSQSLGSLATQLRDEWDGDDDQPKPINPDDLDLRSNCPACMELMDAHPYYGPGAVVIDTCMHCQLAWLDHGELGRIVRAPGHRN